MTDDPLANLHADLRRTPWFDPLRGGLPRVPARTALPTASAELAYRLCVLIGQPATLNICLQAGDSSWEWVEVATGTP